MLGRRRRVGRRSQRRDALTASSPTSASTAATSDPSRIAAATRSMSADERPVVAQPRRERRARARASPARPARARAARGTRPPARRRAARSRAARSAFASTCQRLQPGRVPHRDVILLAGARRDRVDARRMAQHLVLADERSGDVLRDHEARSSARRRSVEERRAGRPRGSGSRAARRAAPRCSRARRPPSRARRARTRAAGRGSSRSRRACPSSTRTSGLSVAAFSSIADGRADVVEQVARRAVHLRRRSAASRRPAPCRTSGAPR